jgi:hypothetical protein
VHSVLEVDATVRLRQDHPQDAVGQNADPREQPHDDEKTPHEDRVYPPTMRKAGGHAPDPAVRSPDDAESTDPREEVGV